MPSTSGLALAFASLEGDLGPAVARARTAAGGGPVGVIVDADSDVIAALLAGADEAETLSSVAPKPFARFVERLLVRAKLRAEAARLGESLVHAERLMALGTLVAGIAHEINNPLTAVDLGLQVVRKALGPSAPDGSLESLGPLLDDLGSATAAIATIVRDLRVFATTGAGEPVELVDVRELADQVLRLVSRQLSHAMVERDYAAVVPALVLPRNRVAQVLVNILVNAAQATREIEQPMHRVRVTVRSDGEFVAVLVADTGPGVPQEHVARIFNPFFTTKRERLGSGLGLSISRAILRDLGGELTVESMFGDGATFLCLLPVPPPDLVKKLAASASVPGKEREPSRALSILVVEDDARVARSYFRLLDPPHRVLLAADALEALEFLNSGIEPDVILLELDLPEAGGAGLLAAIDERWPELASRVVVTASAPRADYGGLRAHPLVVEKPVSGDVLQAALREIGARRRGMKGVSGTS